MSRTSVAAVVALLAVALAVGALVATPAAAAPNPYCGSNADGAMFVADSGFTVEYSDDEPMADGGVFQDGETLRFRDVTLSSSSASALRLENGTGPETCVAAVDATAASIRVAPDGEQAVVIDGQVDALSLADADYGGGSVDLYYEGNDPWTLTLQSTGLAEGTDVEAVDGGGSELATATVDASGDLALQLPGGTREVDLRTADGSGPAGSPQIGVTSVQSSASDVGVDEPVAVDVTLRNDGDASGDHTVTLTADGQPVDDATVTVPANGETTVTLSTRFGQSGTYDLAVDGQDAGSVTVGGGQSNDDGSGDGGSAGDGADGSSDGGLPWLLLGGVAALLVLAGGAVVLARRRSETGPSDAAGDEAGASATPPAAAPESGTGEGSDAIEKGDGEAAEEGEARAADGDADAHGAVAAAGDDGGPGDGGPGDEGAADDEQTAGDDEQTADRDGRAADGDEQAADDDGRAADDGGAGSDRDDGDEPRDDDSVGPEGSDSQAADGDDPDAAAGDDDPDAAAGDDDA